LYLYSGFHAILITNIVGAVGEVQKKMKNLRTQFAKECKKYIKSGSGAGDVKKWKYFQSLLFLQAFTIQNTNTLSNFTHEPVGKSFCILTITLCIQLSSTHHHVTIYSIYISSVSIKVLKNQYL